MSERTARNYISAAEAFSDVSATVSVLPARAVYALASPATPAEFRAVVVERLEAGEAVDPNTLIHQTTEAQRAAKEAKKVAALSEEEKQRREKNEKARLRAQEKRDQSRWAEDAQCRERRAQKEAAALAAAAAIAEALGDRRAEITKLIGDVDAHNLANAIKATFVNG